MCRFTSFPNFAYLCSYANFRAFFFGAILVHARHRDTIDVLNGSPQCGLNYCWIFWDLVAVQGRRRIVFYFLYFWILDLGL